MERSEIKGSMCVPVLKKLEEHGSVGFTKRPYNNVRAGYHLERAKKERAKKEHAKKRRWHRYKLKPDEVKEMVVDAGSKERAKKRRGLRYKLKPDEVKDMVADAGSKEESLAQPAEEGNTGDKTKLDEVNKIVVDAGSKEEMMSPPTREGERTKRLVTQEVLDYILNVELVDYMLCNSPRKFTTPTVSKILFIPQEGASMSALLNGTRKLEADVLRENRANEEAWQVYPRELMLD